MRIRCYSAAVLVACISTAAIVGAQNSSSCAATAGNSGMNCSAPELCCSGTTPQCYQPSQSQCCQWDQADGLCAVGETCCGAGAAGTAVVACCQNSWQCCNVAGSSSVSCCPPGTTCSATGMCLVMPTPAPPTPVPVPPATYAWVTDNQFMSSSFSPNAMPFAVGGQVVVPAYTLNSTPGVAALNASNGAVLWNYTASIYGYPWLPQDGNRRHVYLLCNESFIAVDVATGRLSWEYNPGLVNENYPEIYMASGDVIAVMNATDDFEVRNATTGQLLLTQLDLTMVIDGGNNTLFLSSQGEGSTAFQRFDLRSKKTVWNVTLNASSGVNHIQANWRRGEVFITGSSFAAVLDVETGAVKNMVGNRNIVTRGVQLPRAPHAMESLLAIAWGSDTGSWNSVCALNTSTLQCAWETFNATCGNSALGEWFPAAYINYVGADVIVTVGSSGACLHGYSAADGALLWNATGGSNTDQFQSPLAVPGPGNATTVVSFSATTTTVLTVDAQTGVANQVQASPNLVTIGVSDCGLIIGLGASHVYGINP
jgi:hypothetical protein